MKDKCHAPAGPMDRKAFVQLFDGEDEADAHLARDIGLHLAEDEQVLGCVRPFGDLRAVKRGAKAQDRTVILTSRRFLLVDVHLFGGQEGQSVSVESVPTFLLRCVTTHSAVRLGACVQSSVRLDFSRPAFASNASNFGPPESVLQYAVDGLLSDEVRAFLAAVAEIARSTSRAATSPQK